MAKVTGKLQVTIPKSIADRLGIRPGDDVAWEAGEDVIRLVPARPPALAADVERRLALFRGSVERQRRRQRRHPRPAATSRGWTREDLYDRGRSR